METNKNFEEGTIFNLRLPYREDTPPSPLYGEVRWKKRSIPTYIYGVKFIGLNFLERRCLDKYIQTLLQGGKNGKEK